MSNEIERAQSLLRTEAVQWINERVDKLVQSGDAQWQPDPYVSGVVGVIDMRTSRALVIVYLLEDDFEVDEDALSATRATHDPGCPHDGDKQRIAVGAPGVGYVVRCVDCREVIEDHSRILEPWETE